MKEAVFAAPPPPLKKTIPASRALVSAARWVSAKRSRCAAAQSEHVGAAGCAGRDFLGTVVLSARALCWLNKGPADQAPSASRASDGVARDSRLASCARRA